MGSGVRTVAWQDPRGVIVCAAHVPVHGDWARIELWDWDPDEVFVCDACGAVCADTREDAQ
jgi:hypothetical protein